MFMFILAWLISNHTCVSSIDRGPAVGQCILIEGTVSTSDHDDLISIGMKRMYATDHRTCYVHGNEGFSVLFAS